MFWIPKISIFEIKKFETLDADHRASARRGMNCRRRPLQKEDIPISSITIRQHKPYSSHGTCTGVGN